MKMTITYKNQKITCTITKSNVQVVDSYKIRKAADMKAIIKLLRAEAAKKGFKYKRSESSWLTEWKAHNYMYDRNKERARTRSVDLNEGESRLKLLSYSAMALLYRG
jgi:hypothetical protein